MCLAEKSERFLDLIENYTLTSESLYSKRIGRAL
tara:strand:+ start:4678 stop:4779 length:102 start_codon:yes stop_codon:yes gene_type:complete